MNNAIQVFQNQKSEFGTLRSILKDGEPWVVAKDVLTALGYAPDYQPSRALQAVPEEWKGVHRLHTPGGWQDMLVLSESGAYFFLARSDKPAALPFQKWLAGEVVPSIRKTGQYNTANDPMIAEYMKAGRLVLEAAGITGNQLALAMDKYLVAYGGRSMLTAANVELVAPMQGQLLTPTELGKEFDPVLSAKAINLLLAAAGLQKRLENVGWEPTEEGKAMGAVLLDTGKKHKHNGTPVRQLKWTRTPELFNRLREQIAAQVQEAV